MSPRIWLPLVIAGSVGVMLYAARTPEAAVTTQPARQHERAWLTPYAADQIATSTGALGPLFDGLTLGASEPTPELRARVAAFAKANDVDIRFEVTDHELVAIRFSVTYGGCCGYEGADRLATRFDRPTMGHCCVCGEPKDINDWNITAGDGTHVRARVRVNRFEARWEASSSLRELLEKADSVLGANKADLRKAAGDHWVDAAQLLEVPYPFTIYSTPYAEAGIHVEAERGRVTSLKFRLDSLEQQGDVLAIARTLWGRGRTMEGEQKQFRSHGHDIRIDSSGDRATVVMSEREMPRDSRYY